MKKKLSFPKFQLPKIQLFKTKRRKTRRTNSRPTQNRPSETNSPEIQSPKTRSRKIDLSKITPFHVVCVQFGIAIVLMIILLVILLVPNDGVPDFTVPPTTTASTEDATEEPTELNTEPTEPERTMLPKMQQLYEENPDVIGWITIPDSKVDYPVMYTPYEPQKYIHANFKGLYSIGGLPFIDANCSFDPESDNLIFYAHNMNNGTQFQNITHYAYRRWALEHNLIYFSTLYEERVYEVVAAFPDKIYSPLDDVFKFYQFIDAETEEEFNEAVEYYLDKTVVDFGVTPEYGDRLITLVTCAYHEKYGRFVVVAREVVPEEPEATQPIDG